MRLTRLLLLVLIAAGGVPAQGDRVFTLPLRDLQQWADNIVVTLDQVTIRGNSGVHRLQDDCEMHFGAEVSGYRGSPAGWVLEPMNLCLEPFFGRDEQRNQDWLQFARSLLNKEVRAAGVPRIWPEHLDGEESPSNPNHALELHPLTGLSGAGPARDFSSFIFAPETYQGGVSCKTAETILTKTKVGVTRRDDEVEVDFDAGRIGNFTVVDIRVRKENIQEAPGGHRLNGEVILESGESLPVAMITVAGSRIDARLGRFRTGQRRTARLEVLVLFSLDPKALLAAAQKSAGQRREVPQPLQLIVYGVSDAGCR
jgi:hypothetical protein